MMLAAVRHAPARRSRRSGDANGATYSTWVLLVATNRLLEGIDGIDHGPLEFLPLLDGGRLQCRHLLHGFLALFIEFAVFLGELRLGLAGRLLCLLREFRQFLVQFVQFFLRLGDELVAFPAKLVDRKSVV